MSWPPQPGGCYTPEDLLKIDDRLMPELVDGELVEREPLGHQIGSDRRNVA